MGGRIFPGLQGARRERGRVDTTDEASAEEMEKDKSDVRVIFRRALKQKKVENNR